MEDHINSISSAMIFKRKKIKINPIKIPKLEKIDFSTYQSLPSIKSRESLDDFSDIKEIINFLSLKANQDSNFDNSTLDSERDLLISPLSNNQKLSQYLVLTPGRTNKRKDFIIRKKNFRTTQAMTDR